MSHNQSTPKNDPHYVGHRQRLKRRFLAGNKSSKIADYELLELLLYLAVPRRDVKPLAKELLRVFGSFAAVINADTLALNAIKGVGENVIVALKIVRESAVKLAQEQVLNRPVLSSWSALINYCRVAMAHAQIEEFHILFLNKKNELIADEIQQSGTIDHTPVYPREVVKRALEVGSSAIILVHNHPSGDPNPSHADIDMTKKLIEAGKAVGVTVHDHIIIAKAGHTSFKTLGLL